MDKRNEIVEICSWINVNDIFWLSDLKVQFNVTETPRSENYHMVVYLIEELKKKGYIQCCEYKASMRQYILVKPIDLENIKSGTGKIKK